MGIKKLFIAIGILLSIASEAQVKQQLGTYGVRTRRMQADSAFKLPTFAVGIKDNYAGFDTAQLRYRFTDSTVLVYTGSQWIAVGSGGGTTYTFTNGLTESGGTVKLGGTLVDATTTIDGNENNLLFTDLNSISTTATTDIELVATNSAVLSRLSGSSITVSQDIALNSTGGSTYSIGIPYTLSTTGKKIMLRDTATGLVQNIDASLLTGSTPTLQQVLTAGSTLTTNNTIDADGNTFNIDNTPRFRILDDNSSTERLFIAQTGASVSAPTRYTTKLSSGIKSDVQRYLMLSPDSTVLTGIPYTLSTTGKKIMLRDTATGLVQNIDPALLGGSTAISALTAATGTNSIDNGANLQEWQWNSLAGTNGFKLSSNSTAAVDGQRFAFISSTGANASSSVTTTALTVSNDHTGTSSTNVAGYFASNDGTNNYAIIVPGGGGSVGIGTSTPASILHTVGTVRHATLGTATGDTTANKPLGINSSGDIIPMTYWPGGGGGSTSPAGNYGNLQLNRNGAFATPGSDSLDWESATGLTVKGNITSSTLTSGRVVIAGTSGLLEDDAGLTYDKSTNALKVAGTAGSMPSFFNANSTSSASTTNSNPGVLWYAGGSGSNYGAMLGYHGGFGSEFFTGDGTSIFWSRGGGTGATTSAFTQIMTLNTSNQLLIDGGLYVGSATSAPTAAVHIKAGTATASTAPLKFTSGTNLTTAEAGAVEFDGKDLFFTPTGTIRKVIPTIISSRSTGQTAAVASVATQTVGASDASFMVSANILVTTSSAEAFTTTVAYTDEGNTARTLTLNYSLLAGTIGVTIAAANGAVPYQGVPVQIRCKASTTITIATTGTFTGCTYNVEGTIQKIQ